MKLGYLFPGQGAQYPGMCKPYYETSPNVRRLFEQASDLVHRDLARLLFESTDEELKETSNTQLSITLANLATYQVLKDRGWEPSLCAGFSLGEYSALVVSGVLSIEAVFPLVKKRGELMAEAAEKLDRSQGNPGMAAVMGLGPEQVLAIVQGLGRDDVFCANFNSPVQTVISGTAEGLAKAEEALKAGGAKRIITLKVSGPFHSPLLVEASRAFREVLKDVVFNDPKITLFSNVTGQAIDSGLVAKELAAQQIISPVRWTDEMQGINKLSPDGVLEVGPGTVLTGLWKAQFAESVCYPVGKPEDLEKVPFHTV
jgi:[acyl-carrier-protein] S-malonyltransferase